MQSSSQSSVSSHHPSSFIAHPGALPGASGGFALDSSHADRPLHEPNRNRLEHMVHDMERSLPLPTSFRGYLLFLCWLILIVGGMGILALMSAQILESRVRLRQLNQEYTLIQQRNSELVWLIARETNLERVQRRLAGKGYVPARQVEYVVLGGRNSGAAEVTPPGVTQPALSERFLPENTAFDAETLSTRLWESDLPSNMATAINPARNAPVVTTIQAGAPTNWLAALGEGFNRWEALFRDNRLERAEPALRSQDAPFGTTRAQPAAPDSAEIGVGGTGAGEMEWSWQSWLPQTEWRFFDAMQAWRELLPWLNQ